jgi:hypothetical protein
VGPTVKGPVGIPTTVTTYSDFLVKFGGAVVSSSAEYSYFTGISAQNYFKQGGTNLLVTRVVNNASGSYTAATSSAIITGSATGALLSGASVDQVFTIKTISQGANQNSTGAASGTPSETTGNALASGSKDNLRWEITNVDSGSGIFTLLIRQGDDRASDKNVLETWRGVSLDPTRDDYIAKVIGNQEYSTGLDGSDAYVSVTGEYPNKSKYVIISSVTNTTPRYLDGAGNFKPEFTASLPAAQSGSFGAATGADFVVPAVNFYSAIDAANTQGLTADDYTASLNLLRNKDQYAFNVVSVPGLFYEGHSTTLDTLITNTTTRGDSILPIDLVAYGSSSSQVVDQANSLNTNYAAAYWPWLLVKDENTGANVWCPASTIIPSVYIFNDTNSEAWFAPAGFTRGTMPNVVAPEKTLPRAIRDTLYNAKVNPIATFPGTVL